MLNLNVRSIYFQRNIVKFKVGDIVKGNTGYFLLITGFNDFCYSVVPIFKKDSFYQKGRVGWELYISGVDTLDYAYEKHPNNPLSRAMFPKAIEDGKYLKIKVTINQLVE